MEDIKKKLTEIAGDRLMENVPLCLYTSFKTGGPARYMAVPANLEEIKNVFLACRQHGISVLIMGRGTNMLISDEGIDGVVLLTENLDKIFVKENLLLCESGAKISRVIKTAMLHSLGGIEFLAGIPGSVGGALISNAGLKDSWISRAVSEIYVLSPDTFEAKNINGADAGFGYRKSGLENFFIYRSILRLKKTEPNHIKKTLGSYMKKRMEGQPLSSHSAGSIFKNPPGAFAGQLIEKAGMKGYACGDAAVSEKHANFIINRGKATSRDIYTVIEAVQRKVEKVHNIVLEPEIKTIGRF